MHGQRRVGSLCILIYVTIILLLQLSLLQKKMLREEKIFLVIRCSRCELVRMLVRVVVVVFIVAL